MKFNLEEVNQLMQRRRSIFPADYTGEEVPDHAIEKMLENATYAPTHKLTEPWRFVVFKNNGLAKLAAFQSECYRQVTSQNGTFREERYKGLQTKPMQSSCIIAIGMIRDEKKGVPEVEEIGAVFCAIENMYLTAAAYGLGCYFSTGGITYFDGAKAFFGLGSSDRLLGFLHIGIPKAWPAQKTRKPPADVTRWVVG